MATKRMLDRLDTINRQLADRGAVPDLPTEDARRGDWSDRDLRLIIEASQHRLAVLMSTNGRL